MTTGQNDFIQWESVILGTVRVPLTKVGLEWPPPESIYLGPAGEIREFQDGDPETFRLNRVHYSNLPDDVADHPNLARGAVYEWQDS